MPRPKSETDFSEVVAEQELFIEHLDEEVLNSKFEEMLNDMNLNEEKKEPLRSQPSMNKKKMLMMHYKGATLSETRSKFDKPADYIQYLSQPDLSVNKIYNCIESLRIALTNNTLSWVQEFGTQGLAELLKQLNECYARSDSRYDRIQYECLRCIKAIMNNTVGIKQVFSRKEALTIVARSLNPSKELVMLEALRVLAPVCLIEPDGHQRVVYAITESSEMKNIMRGDVTDRFGPVVQGLMNTSNEPLRVACLTLINAIVLMPEDLDFRQHLRNEIMRTGLGDILDGLEKVASKDLAIQVTCFKDHEEDDYHELMQRFDNVGMELDDINDCYEINKNLVMDSPAEPYLLSIFRHLLKNLSLVRLYQIFKTQLQELQVFWEVLEELDKECRIIDPDVPSRSHTHRRIAICSNVSIQVTVDPYNARQRPDVKFLGSEMAIRPLHKALSETFEDWLPCVSIVNNLLDSLGITGFPARPEVSVDEMQLVRPGECCVCYMVRAEDGQLPSEACDNTRCGSHFHQVCLYQWLTTVPNNTTSFNRIYGQCPNCDWAISCPTVPIKQQ